MGFNSGFKWLNNSLSQWTGRRAVFCVRYKLKFVRVDTDTDWAVCSWPWQLLALGKTDRPLFVSGNWYILVINTLGWSAGVLCAYNIKLFYVVLCVTRAVHKSDLRLVTNETPNKWRPVERTSCSDIDSCFWQDLYVTLRLSSRVLWGCT